MQDLGIFGQLMVGKGMADTRATAIERGLSQVLSAVNACDDRNMALLQKHEPELFEFMQRFARINMERVPE